ncbi:YfiR family protein [Marinigracilibium pacificum]|uniref:YfiR family protein n=1 Tax=Marinigracilibium pacificum TaxID=2729599 RepID=A0A848IYN5_9BACT|nr:YfiR family protein [Marinigracilibium pacificum]NMM48746.1 YfiR family protein [Marinigracilibium pacificum]
MKTFFKFLFITVLAASINFNGEAQNEKIKTAFLYQFSRYIQWPAQNSSFVYGVYGDGPIYNALANMAKTRSGSSQNFKVVKITNLDDALNCNILFVTDQINDIDAVKQTIGKSPTLVVSEKDGFGKKGSEINFTNKQGKLRFELNTKSAEEKGLMVSGELKNLAILL